MVFQFSNKNKKLKFKKNLIRVWNVSFNFQFKYKMEIEEIVKFDFLVNIEY